MFFYVWAVAFIVVSGPEPKVTDMNLEFEFVMLRLAASSSSNFSLNSRSRPRRTAIAIVVGLCSWFSDLGFCCHG